jgi:hypothetical protein
MFLINFSMNKLSVHNVVDKIFVYPLYMNRLDHFRIQNHKTSSKEKRYLGSAEPCGQHELAFLLHVVHLIDSKNGRISRFKDQNKNWKLGNLSVTQLNMQRERERQRERLNW